MSLDGAVSALRAGSVVAVPTDTVYGLAVDPRVPGATAALFALKGRPESLALPVLIPDLASAVRLAGRLPRAALEFASRCWPGPLTIVVDVMPAGHAASYDLGGDGSTIGMRCPDHDALLELLRAAGPLAVTSANRHGAAPLTSAASVREAFVSGLAVVVDGGTCEGRPSTVVACNDGSWEILRPGPVTERTLAELAVGYAREVEA